MEQLIVVFTPKRNIGITAIPYLAKFNANQPIELVEHATPEHIKKKAEYFTQEEKELINLLTRISDQQLHRKYSREGTLKQFMETLPLHKFLDSLILPFIDDTLYLAIKLLAKSEVKAYYKDSFFGNLYNSDLLSIPREAAKPLFDFELTAEELIYSLRVSQILPGKEEPKEFSLMGRNVEFICKKIAVIKINNQVYFFENIDHNKFKPFLNTNAIHVPASKVETYMAGFVANCIRSFDVNASGFTIDIKSESPSPQLSLIKNIGNEPVLGLHFKYPNRTFLADKKSSVYVDCVKEGPNYRCYKIIRNFVYEETIVKHLIHLGLEKCGDALFKPAACPKDINETAMLSYLAEWIAKNTDKLKHYGVSVDTSFFGRQIYLGVPKLVIDSHENGDWFDIQAKVLIGDFVVPFLKFRKNLIEGQPEYELPNKQIFLIPPEWFTRFSELFDYAKLDKDSIRLPRTHFDIMERVKHGSSRLDNEKHKPGIVFPSSELPEGINATLRPYQIEGYEWLNFLKENGYGGILADDMGLGKTLQTISLLQKIYQGDDRAKGLREGMIEPSLIVMPTSLIHNWQSELNKFAPALRVYNYTGGNRLKSKDIWKVFNHYHVVLTSYGVLRNDIELLGNCSFHYFILDESQYVKNPGSKIYAAVKTINSKYRLTLTGTPIENSLVDLWAQMNLVNKGLLGSLAFFKRSFILPITRQNDQEKEQRLQRLIQPFLLRRTKEKVAGDLPPIMEQTLYCDMTPEQESFYEREKSGVRNSIAQIFEGKSSGQNKMIALEALTKLRQIANHPLMIDKTYTGSSGKFEQIIDNLENIIAEGHNVLVFSSFTKDLELLETVLKERKLQYSMLTGKTKERERVIKEFNNKASVFLISLKAGGVGLNLTKADYVFMLNPWWNPAAEAQAISRAHRIGQTKSVFVYRFLSSGTIEEKIAKLQQEKSELADTFINSNNPLSELSREDILELFS
ncbi:MAG TPA: SNF family helicase [Marinilabiliaceae bacterium]|nr:SNF family helicase [Marinilabiliaceae bacterium]HBX88588.1 SNF family helicase [Marinilabiliaceae bacterium]